MVNLNFAELPILEKLAHIPRQLRCGCPECLRNPPVVSYSDPFSEQPTVAIRHDLPEVPMFGQCLGSGYFKRAYAVSSVSSGPDTVLVITKGHDDFCCQEEEAAYSASASQIRCGSARDFALRVWSIMAQHQDDPFCPKIQSFGLAGPEERAYCVMERLESWRESELSFVIAGGLRDFAPAASAYNEFSRAKEVSPMLRALLNLPSSRLDPHCGNIMVRGATTHPVLVDPVCPIFY